MLNKKNSHAEPFEFERLSPAGDFTRGWSRAAHAAARSKPDISSEDLRALNPQLIRAASCALANNFYQWEGKDVLDVEDATPVSKKGVGHNFIYFDDFCYWIFDATADSWAKFRKQHDVTARLEEAANTGNEVAFSDMLKEVDWHEKSASEFIRIIDWALEVGAHLAARQIATKGAETYPHDVELQKYAHVLAPPKVVANRAPRNVNQAANVEWLKANKNEYKGKWVAVKDGVLLAAADSYENLIAQVGETKGRGILVTTVY